MEKVLGLLKQFGCTCGERHAEGSCPAHILTIFLRSLAVGVAGKTLLNVASFLLVIKKKLKKNKNKNLLKILTSLIDLRWGIFLAVLSGGWTGLSCLLRSLILKKLDDRSIAEIESESDTTEDERPSSKRLRDEIMRKKLIVAHRRGYLVLSDLLAGGVAGLSLFCLRAEDRKAFALYFMVRSAEFVCRMLAIQKRFPDWLIRVGEHYDVILMCATASQILSSYAFEPWTLSPTYFKFLLVHGGKDRRVINAISELHGHRPISVEPIKTFCKDHNIPDWKGTVAEFSTFQICPLLHPHMSCTRHFGVFLKDAFFRAVPLYAPIHIVTTAVVLLLKLSAKIKERRRLRQLEASRSEEDLAMARTLNASAAERQIALKRRLKEILLYTGDRILLRLLINIFRSSLFLALYCAGAWYAACAIHRLTKIDGPFLVRLVLGLAGLACLVEVKPRRGELAMYCLPQALESISNELIEKKVIPQGVVKRAKHVEVVFFCLALAATIFCYRNEPTSIKPSFYFGMKWLWG
jgi:hypothetical protein